MRLHQQSTGGTQAGRHGTARHGTARDRRGVSTFFRSGNGRHLYPGWRTRNRRGNWIGAKGRVATPPRQATLAASSRWI